MSDPLHLQIVLDLKRCDLDKPNDVNRLTARASRHVEHLIEQHARWHRHGFPLDGTNWDDDKYAELWRRLPPWQWGPESGDDTD